MSQHWLGEFLSEAQVFSGLNLVKTMISQYCEEVKAFEESAAAKEEAEKDAVAELKLALLWPSAAQGVLHCARALASGSFLAVACPHCYQHDAASRSPEEVANGPSLTLPPDKFPLHLNVPAGSTLHIKRLMKIMQKKNATVDVAVCPDWVKNRG